MSNPKIGEAVHMDHPINDTTLCGLALEGAFDGDHQRAVYVGNPIDCKQCLEIMLACYERLDIDTLFAMWARE